MDRSKIQKEAKKKYLKRHKASKRRKQNDSSGDESIDLSEKMHPIAYYMNNRQEMMEQVFSVMEQEKLNCMLPPILKGMSVSLLKEKCLNELTNMSNDEVRKVLCGEPLEAPSQKVLTVSHADSDSCESLSSVEECSNQDQEKRTLLDILEQEMQAIAYHTVMKRSGNFLLGATDDLPEIIPIPVDPTSKKNAPRNVPLVCIDSEDDERPSISVPPPLIDVLDEPNVLADARWDRGVECTVSIQKGATQAEEKLCAQNDKPNKNDEEMVSDNSKDSVYLHQKSNEPLERFLIQVFPKKTSKSDRVVKKVCRTGCNEKDTYKAKSSHVNQHSVKCPCVDSKTKPAKETDQKIMSSDMHTSNEETCEDSLNLQNRTELLSHETITPLDEKNCQPVSGREVLSVSHNISPTSQPTEVSVEHEEDSDSAKNKISVVSTACGEEKEEGEITEGESEEDIRVLEAVQDRHRSPSIFLSSDSNDVKSDQEHTARAKHRKLHHRHKRNKRSVESPERSRRRIEKRGNRSYRRKATSSTHENVKFTEKEKESINNVNDPKMSKDLDFEATGNETLSLGVPKETELGHKFGNNELVEASGNSEDNNLESKLNSSDEAEGLDDAEPLSDKTSWADRWAKKKDLKKVVITSKICRNVRKRILSARKKQTNQETTSVQSPTLPPVPPLVLHVEGSVQEYQMLQLLVSDVCEESHNNNSGMETDSSPKTADLNPMHVIETEFKDMDVTEVIKNTSSDQHLQNSRSALEELYMSDVEEDEPSNKVDCN